MFPVTALAKDCQPNDFDCRIEQLQLQTIKKGGIKPIEIVQVPATSANDKKNADTKIIQPKPFKIPLPILLRSKPATTTQQPKQATSISAPNSADSKTQEDETQESVSTTETQYQQPVSQPTGIQYR